MISPGVLVFGVLMATASVAGAATEIDARPTLTETGFVVQASEYGSLRLVEAPRDHPVGSWIECSHLAVPSFDAPVDVVTDPVVPRAGGVYSLWCWYEPDHDVVPGYPTIVQFDPIEPVPGLVDAVDVAEFAQSRLDLVAPEPGLSPPLVQIVGVETWLAVVSDIEYADVTAQAGRAWATVRTTFRDVVWEMGDGSVVTCVADATTTWNPLADGGQRSACTHTYVDSSPVGYQASVTATWTLTWVNNESPVDFVPWATISLTSPVTIDVIELQAVIR